MSKKTRAERNLKFETLQLHVGQENPDPATGARAVPIYQTSSFVFNNSDHAAARFGLQDAGNIYGRLTNPTEDVFEQRMAALEGGVAALAVASGAAAINYTIINLAQKGDHIVSAKNIYGGSYNLLAHTLPQYGISTTFVDVFDLDEVRAAVQENTKPSTSRPSEIRTLMLSISKHLQKLRMRTKFRWLSIIPSQLHTSFVRSSTAQTSLFIPQLNLSAVTELPLVV